MPMTFEDVERQLGFELPPSARRHPAWWSNNHGTNVAVAAWKNAGFRTSRVDVPGERVVFVRETPEPAAYGGVCEAGAETSIAVAREALSPAALRLLEDLAEEARTDLAGAIAKLSLIHI